MSDDEVAFESGGFLVTVKDPGFWGTKFLTQYITVIFKQASNISHIFSRSLKKNQHIIRI